MGTATYDRVARLLHWAIALMVLVQIPAGVGMTSEPLGGISTPLYVLHKGMGSVLLVLVFVRILWRLTHRPPAFPDSMPALEQRIAHRTHIAIYALLVAMVVSGYLRTVADEYPIELLDALGVPPLVGYHPRLAEVMLVVHQFAVLALLGLIAIHIAAVLRHHLIDRDATLGRMWPPF